MNPFIVHMPKLSFAGLCYSKFTMAMLTGNVIHGDGFAGEGYGIPTANLSLLERPDLAPGVYAGYATWGDKHFESLICFDADRHGKFEVHLFDFTGNLYDTRLSVDVRSKLSDLVPWTGEEAMRKKVGNDVNRARAFFESQKHLA